MALVPPTVVTRTSAGPALPAGVVRNRVVEFSAPTFVAATPPTVAPVAPLRLVPVTVTTVPPATDPELGERPVTVGGAT